MREVTSTTAAASTSTSGNMETLEGSSNNGQQGSSPPAPKKKICCACPDTKRLRDECVVTHGEDACGKWIYAHKLCLRAEGFKV